MKKIFPIILCLLLIISSIGKVIAAEIETEEKKAEKTVIILISGNCVYVPYKYKPSMLVTEKAEFYLKNDVKVAVSNYSYIATTYEKAMDILDIFKKNNYIIFE